MASSAPAGAPACAPPPGTVLGSQGRESPRGSSEDEPPQARQCVLPPAVLGRRHGSAPPPPTTSHRAGDPLLGLGHLFPTLPGTPAPTTHGDMGGEGKGKGKGKLLGRSPNSSVSVIPTCPSQHPFRPRGVTDTLAPRTLRSSPTGVRTVRSIPSGSRGHRHPSA